ncbi:hypothetical protein BFT35_13075 [Thermoanaerobacterium thermosaccharolyticum]|jgi:CXXX repeat modification system protein|uniref:CXXX repeat peptide modification system protein n=1 Tax=Thermoanaerobacterium TaxID=28895 RepID=UPI0004B6B2BB|nr:MULTISPECIES: CXXX repeat peptide modification system protein [Thermoanaerobacterium]KAA5806825.1 CXXX repeat peptide modification system protein [Thermoanaerobacterium thermosaccharolyticum]PHO06091.1 hypothetical protein BFT35_13075 [Thermoanaerobacterium thermosaccharolyticum]WHE07780.1 CXXX repeat peptide modification system protein [Thermoanaerobacterium thermosaccharolyticum]WKV10435.1 CXXX repeat peptide modification system protein [Thermoanaerobacterium sp. CMT5567-10]
MYKEKIGYVSEQEKYYILELEERLSALKELIIVLNDQFLSEEKNNNLYEKIMNDIFHTKLLQDKWWREMKTKYNFKFYENGKWMVNFDTNEVFLIIND